MYGVLIIAHPDQDKGTLPLTSVPSMAACLVGKLPALHYGLQLKPEVCILTRHFVKKLYQISEDVIQM
jgi:hypothetical protein